MGASKSVQRPAKPDHLFILPLEIRRAIYTYLLPEHGIHLSQIENGETRLSACCDPDLYNHEMGLERLEFVPPAKDDQVWQKRLLSPWGPHWRCEEEVRMGLRASGESLLGVCKATRFEFAEVLAENAAFEVTSLQHLATLTKPQPTFSIGSFIIPRIVELSITLNLPYRLFLELQGSTSLPDGGQLPEDVMPLILLWQAYPNNILRSFPNLRILRLWVDHDEPKLWSAQNMLTVVDSVNKLVSLSSDNETGTGKASTSIHRLTLVLPQLLPHEEVSFQKPMSNMEICRVARQRYRVRENEAGSSEVYYAEELPDVSHRVVSLASLAHISEIEAFEARMWD